MANKTGLVCDEQYFWHDIGAGALFVPTGEFVEADELSDGPKSKKRTKNLLDRCGLTKKLVDIEPRMASVSDIERCHVPSYVKKIKDISDANGGDAGAMAVVGKGSFEIALLAAGGAIQAVDAVMTKQVDNAYVLCRPIGHHAEPDQGMGYCIFNNAAIAAKYAREVYGLKRILILDWDAHHGNGTEKIFFTDPGVLFISLHQEFVPFNKGHAETVGEMEGEGYNVNIPLPAGTGDAGYLYALEKIVSPITDQFHPELIIVSAGQDANLFDQHGRMMMTADGFEQMTKFVSRLADKHCEGKIVVCQEGGYSPGYIPFCTLRVIEALSDIRTGIEDPFVKEIAASLPKTVSNDQHSAIHRVIEIHSKYWDLP